MKYVPSLAFLIFLGACSKPEPKPVRVEIACLPGQLSNSVIAFYPFSNGSINDFSGMNNHLSNNTSAHPTIDRQGNVDCAFSFSSGANEFLTTTNTNFLNNLNQFSISLWYRPIDSSRAGGSFEVLVSRGYDGSCPNRRGQWSIGLYDCRRAVFGGQNSVWDTLIMDFDMGSTCEDEVNIRTGGWHHLAVAYDGVTQQMMIARDGVLQEAVTGIVDCGNGPVKYDDVGDLFIGKDYNGDIDDIIIYKRVLSTQEIKELYNLGSCCN